MWPGPRKAVLMLGFSLSLVACIPSDGFLGGGEGGGGGGQRKINFDNNS